MLMRSEIQSHVFLSLLVDEITFSDLCISNVFGLLASTGECFADDDLNPG